MSGFLINPFQHAAAGRTPYLYYRWNVTKVAGTSDGWLGTSEVFLRSTVGGANLSTTGWVATAKSSYAPWPPSRVIDGSFTTNWGTTDALPQWLRLQLPSAVGVAEYGVSVFGNLVSDTDRNARSFGTFTFEGSNDGSTWTVLDSRALSATAWNAPNETLWFTVP